MAKKAIPHTIKGLTNETERTSLMAMQITQLQAQNYSVDEKYSQIKNNKIENKILHANLAPKIGLVLVMNKIKRFVYNNLVSQLCKPLQFLNVNSRAAAIDEIKDIYHL